MLAARPAKRRSASDSDVIVACTAFYTASLLVSICMRCAYFATIGQSFDWREPIGLQERLEGRSSHNGEFSVKSRSRSQGTEVTIVTGDVLLSVTACRRKRCFLWPMANKVNITWQVKVKRFQMFFILRFKVKSCLILCRPIIGNELAAEITQQNE